MVGAPRHDHSSLTEAGAVYIFRNNGSGVWSQEQKLVSANPANHLWFGASVAIDGTSIIVGEPNSTGDASSGKAYVFTYGGSSWSQQDDLVPPSGLSVDQDFGASVAISGDLAVVGAPKSGGGSVVAFVRSSTTWSSGTALTACDLATGDRYGASVSISGECVVAGSPLNDNDGLSSGSAYVWRKVGQGWVEVAKLFSCDGAGGDRFGTAVSVDRGVAAAGAPFSDVSATDLGRSYNYDGFSPCECFGDLNESGTINGVDLAILLGEWTGGSTYSPCPPLNDADLNGDCHVDGYDLAILLGSWGRCPGDQGCTESFGGGSFSEGEGEPTEDEVAELLGFQDADSFYDWVKTADVEEVQAAGVTLIELLGD